MKYTFSIPFSFKIFQDYEKFYIQKLLFNKYNLVIILKNKNSCFYLFLIHNLLKPIKMFK